VVQFHRVAAIAQRGRVVTEPGADRDPGAGSPRGVVVATGPHIQPAIDDFAGRKDPYATG
jgi:cation diffusion facilitator CzcD-associated flavoprotein CzcO